MSGLIINKTVTIPLSEFQFRSVHSSGPGGQNVNKVNSKVVLRWNVRESAALSEPMRQRFEAIWASRINQDGWTTITSQRHRERRRNQDDCLSKLRRMLQDALKPVKPRRPTRPTRASGVRRRQDKQKLSQKKQLRRSPPSSD
jgi:ribosome-associated protein